MILLSFLILFFFEIKTIMKKLLFLLLFTMTFTACNTDVKSKELKVLENSNSSELTFILELNTKNN